MILNQMKKSINMWFWLTVCTWTLIIIASLLWDWHKYNQDIESFSIQEATTRFDDIIIARAWNAKYQGVYGKIDQQTPPNPYLEGVVKERDITTPSGVRLTLINPAYMTRQLNELLEDRLGLSAHLTSLKPIRPANAPDEWETKALQAFEMGIKEVHQIKEFNGQQQMRLMRPLFTKKSCLQCHARQGYKEGDILGGLSVAIPMEKYAATASMHKQKSSIWHGFIWLLGLIGLIFSRHHLKAADLKYHQSQEKFRLLFNHSNDAIFLHDHYGFIKGVNPEGLNLFGYSQAELKQMKIFDLYPESSLTEVKYVFEHSAENDSTRFETTLQKRDGTTFSAEVSANVFGCDKGGFFQASIWDITKRKLAEEKVRLLSRSMEQTNEAILITDSNGNIEFVNSAFTKITGYTFNDVLGKTPRILKSGEQNESFYAEMWQKITRGKPWQGRVIDRKKDGSFCPALLAISPVINDLGEITNFIGIQQDMTSYDDLETQFLQAQKMEAIGTLVGGIAHDFNNMLAGITGNLYLVKKAAKDNQEIVQRVNTMEDLSLRAADMIRQLLTFARKDHICMKPLAINSFLKESIKFLSVSVPANITINSDIYSGSMQIEGDATQLHQVLMNLVNNARDALQGMTNPSISIKLETCNIDDSLIKKYSTATMGTYAHLSITDNGSGIPKQNIEHLFEPFFTTKEEGKGTGLGLAMVFGAVKNHHGFIDVKSSKSQGTTFHLYLPMITTEQDDALSSAKLAPPSKGDGEAILIVDDQQDLLETSKSVLEDLGYDVFVASDGKQAVNVTEAHPEIKLIIMDLIMPVMGGKEAAKHIRKANSSVQIIFATGYDKGSELDMSDEVVISKPFSIIELSQLIRKHIRQSL